MRIPALLALLASTPAIAGNGYIPIQGVLTDSSGVAVDGAVDVTFTLYSDGSGATSLWSDTLTVDVVSGAFATELGGNIALDLLLFKNYPAAHLEITVAGDSAMPLVPLDHVPYAAWASEAANADTLQGSTLAEIQAWIPTVSDITAAAYDTETELTDVLDDNYTYTAGTGLTVSANEFAVDQATIEGWATGVCLDTGAEVVTALAGQTLDATTTVGWSSLSGVPTGLADGDDDTTYTAGTGLALNGTAFSVDSVAWSQLTSVPTGLADGDDDTTYTAGTGLTLTNTSFSVNQSQIETWAEGVAYNTEAELTALLDDNYLAIDGNGYVDDLLVLDRLRVADSTNINTGVWIEPATDVYDSDGGSSPYMRVSADSLHTNGLGNGQTFIEGRYIDANGTLVIGTGTAGSDTTSYQRVEMLPTMQAGTVTIDGSGDWQTVSFAVDSLSAAYFTKTPIVVASPGSNGTNTTCVVQTQNVSTTGFEMRCRNVDDEGVHTGGESVNWVAFNAG
ncbi:MAG: hypothetical protein EP330_08750 [Deltaproteobacteria bacterium]|nr:MAG: hypothetical protein EP330_08750 [Deltaproteobacteria bacterium]